MQATPPVADPGQPSPGPGVPAGGLALVRRILDACRAHRTRTLLAALALLAMLSLAVADAVLAEPLRSWSERMMNAKLKGYTVRIAHARLHLWRVAFELENLTLVQATHPDPPVADIGSLKFSLILHELVRFRVAGDLTIQRPMLHINLVQLQEEARSKVKLKDRGWQSAVESIFPIKADRVRVQDGSLLYLSGSPGGKPIQITRVWMLAQNVRNSAAAKGTYPSPVALDGVLFDTGHVQFQGAADFLREPYAAAQGEVRLDRVPLDRLEPFARAYQLTSTGGFLSLDGAVEYTPEAQTAHLRHVLLDALRLDYTTSKATRGQEIEHGKEAVRLGRKVRNAPELRLKVDALRLTRSEMGFVNAGVQPPYRVFISGLDLDLENLSNQADLGRSTFRGRGAFMGTGATEVSGGSRLTAVPADFNVQLKLDDARLPDLNPVLRAHAGVDVAEGQLSVYSEIKVDKGRVEGYVKPLIKNLRIYDRKKDRGKSLGKRVEMHLLQFAAGVFKNSSTQSVATVARISGSTQDPKASEWETIRKLIGNGLFRAIMPGFLQGPAGKPRPGKGT